MGNSYWRSTCCTPLDNALPSALSSCILITGTGAFHSSTWGITEEPSFRLGQGTECFHLPLQRVLKSKYMQHYPSHVFSPLLQAGEGSMVLPVDTNASPSSPPFSWRLWYLNPKPNLFPGSHFFLPAFRVQLVSCSQTFAANMCLLLCPVNSV